MIDSQEGHLENIDKINRPLFEKTISAKETGYIEAMNTLKIGWTTVELGCGQQ